MILWHVWDLEFFIQSNKQSKVNECFNVSSHQYPYPLVTWWQSSSTGRFQPYLCVVLVVVCQGYPLARRSSCDNLQQMMICDDRDRMRLPGPTAMSALTFSCQEKLLLVSALTMLWSAIGWFFLHGCYAAYLYPYLYFWQRFSWSNPWVSGD